MTEPRIVFFDIDGTLYTEEMTLPTSAKEAIRELQEKGIHTAIATGRAPFMFETLRKELNIDTFVSFNGSYVVVDGKVIRKKPLDTNTIVSLQKTAEARKHPMVFLDHEKAAADIGDHGHIAESLGFLKVPYPPVSKDFYKEHDIYQALLFCEAEEENNYVDQFDTLHFIRWHPRSLDILPAGGSKAEGLRAVTDYLGYSMNETAAFGDALNDIEMLEEAGIGIAMGNAFQEVKQAADLVTSSVHENGVRTGLERIGLL
ncbi:Cof-type HAD-IIB family hydrolase [Bacillus piscicola]|uniref:Cof-type HAD-IIB family hydrolase n=1 Tax=Bacillus piscicola TaxID=1632684 RepID=UPI001F092310|nr:Cof-type HAD-IIB family hydrolase [Bacillus piscicola]